jgi:predicted Zn-dependent peptidase
MMFNGAKVWSKTIWPNNGIQWRANNAYTTENVTVYTDWFPASAAAVIFDLEADRISSLSIDPIVESERGVVLRTSYRSWKFSLATCRNPCRQLLFKNNHWPVIWRRW